MKASIKQICDITGFSAATISNALNHKKGVNKTTAETIFRVAREIGYLTESEIKKIKLVIYKRNGLIINDSPFFSVLLKGVETECRASGYEMVICNVERTDEDFEDQVEEIFADKNAAIILLGTELLDEDFPYFMKAQTPFVLLDCWSSNYPTNAVLINNADSSANAVQHLIGKGHRRIGYLKGDFRIKAFTSRQDGYVRTLAKYEIADWDRFVFTVPTTMDGAYRKMKEYLEAGHEMPSAFFADDDMIALGCMKALTEEGYRIPEDISIIGFDDLPFCQISSPRLSTIKVYKEELGQLAVRRIIELIGTKNRMPVKTQVCTEFIERDSVAVYQD